jgi:hypothetical protein
MTAVSQNPNATATGACPLPPCADIASDLGDHVVEPAWAKRKAAEVAKTSWPIVNE